MYETVSVWFFTLCIGTIAFVLALAVLDAIWRHLSIATTICYALLSAEKELPGKIITAELREKYRWFWKFRFVWDIFVDFPYISNCIGCEYESPYLKLDFRKYIPTITYKYRQPK